MTRFTKIEKIWLTVVVLFYVLYNLPFVPAYDSPIGTLIHALVTLIPLWISVYVGLAKVSHVYDDSLDGEPEDFLTERNSLTRDSSPEDTATTKEHEIC